jgi:hypothetical protein
VALQDHLRAGLAPAMTVPAQLLCTACSGAITAAALACAPAASATTASELGCPRPRVANLDTGYVTMTGSYNLKAGPYAGSRCATITKVAKGTVLYATAGCSTVTELRGPSRGSRAPARTAGCRSTTSSMARASTS